MTTCVALLRGINVSGKNRIRMPELKNTFEKLNLSRVETYIQSGNVVFDCEDIELESLTGSIELLISQSFGLTIQVLLRDMGRLQGIINNNPFIFEQKLQPEKLHITFLSKPPQNQGLNTGPHQVEIMTSGKQHSDEFLVKGQEVYLFCPNGYGKTKFSNTYFERVMGVPATTRNWKTINALFELAKQRQS
jgi:uncharacterized protein (DUF1697 family)